jgi:TPR repeat protein
VKKIILWMVVFVAGSVVAKLPISQTAFRKIPLESVERYAAEKKSEAQLELALRYCAGHQVPVDAQKAFEWMNQAAGLKNQEAQYLLSRMYVEGIGVPVDLQKAESWFIAALMTNPTDFLMQKRFKTLIQDQKDAGGTSDAFLKKCAEAGYAPAFVSLYSPVAVDLYSNGQYEEALPLLRKLSDMGDDVSTLHLAKMVAEGLGGLPKDEVQARALYQQLAKNGEPTAQYELAVMVEKGLGGDADSKQADSLYKRSADQGNVDAKSHLAEIEFARFPYVLRPIKELYPKARPLQKIVSVEKNSGEYQNVAGTDVPGLLVKYELPPASEATGFSGIVLVGVELENRKTGARSWFSAEYLYDGPTYDYLCESDLDLFVDQEFDPAAAITSWAVVYGHLLPDGRTVAVFYTDEYRKRSLAELYERNRYSKVITSKLVAKTLPQANMGGEMSDLQGDVGDLEEDVEGNSVIIAALGTSVAGLETAVGAVETAVVSVGTTVVDFGETLVDFVLGVESAGTTATNLNATMAGLDADAAN